MCRWMMNVWMDDGWRDGQMDEPVKSGHGSIMDE